MAPAVAAVQFTWARVGLNSWRLNLLGGTAALMATAAVGVLVPRSNWRWLPTGTIRASR
jgi:hypothetical protein